MAVVIFVSRGNLVTLWGGMRTFCFNNWQSKALTFCSFHYPSSKRAFEGDVVYTQRNACLRSRSSTYPTDRNSSFNINRKQRKTFPTGAIWAWITKMWRISGVVVSCFGEQKWWKDNFSKYKIKEFFSENNFLEMWNWSEFFGWNTLFDSLRTPSKIPPGHRHCRWPKRTYAQFVNTNMAEISWKVWEKEYLILFFEVFLIGVNLTIIANLIMKKQFYRVKQLADQRVGR